VTSALEVYWQDALYEPTFYLPDTYLLQTGNGSGEWLYPSPEKNLAVFCGIDAICFTSIFSAYKNFTHLTTREIHLVPSGYVPDCHQPLTVLLLFIDQSHLSSLCTVTMTTVGTSSPQGAQLLYETSSPQAFTFGRNAWFTQQQLGNLLIWFITFR